MFPDQTHLAAASHIAEGASRALAELFGKKHLYQSVELNLEPARNAVAQEIKRQTRSLRHVATVAGSERKCPPAEDEVLALRWEKRPSVNPINALLSKHEEVAIIDATRLIIELPTVRMICQKCRSEEPFNPLRDSTQWNATRDSPSVQVLIASYECQNCKSDPVVLMVRRRTSKLTLCGRDPIEPLLLPKFLPKESAKFYSAAQVAHNSGNTLAALFLLRVFIEQFWRTLPATRHFLEQNLRPTGEQLGDIYQKTLPTDFKDRFPSLQDGYEKLSDAMHKAAADIELFESWSAKILEHFDARRVFKLE